MTDFSRRLADLSEGKRSLLQRFVHRDGRGAALLPIQARAPRARDLPLAYGQESLWFMCHLAADSSIYNLPSAVRLRGLLDRAALERALGEIVRRHEILRTRFPSTDGRPAQDVLPELSLAVPVVDLRGVPEAEREARARALALADSLRVFDLAEGPLLRVGLYALGEDDHILVIVFHHLVWDGWSIGVMSRELALLYQAFSLGAPSPLPELPIQYADYALWQRAQLSGELLEAQVAYWRSRLAGLPPTALPTDRPRPATPTFSGGVCAVELPGPLAEAIEALAARAGATLFMTLLAAFQIVLGRACDADRIAVGTPVANRRRAEVEGLIGHFANLLVMATDLPGDLTFSQLLARVKETATGAYAHQDIPFELLVDRLHIERDPSENPLFQVLFAVHMDRLEGTATLPGLRVSPFTVSADHSHFDVGVHLWRTPEGIAGYVSYNRDLYHPATITRLLGHYRTLLEATVEAPDRPIADLPILTPEERRWLADRARCAAGGSPAETVPAQIEARAERDPEATAIAHGADRISYRALLDRAHRLAERIRGRGAATLGICARPGIDAAAGALAGLLAGIPLVLLDPDMPPARVSAMTRGAGPCLILADEAASARLAGLDLEIHGLDGPPASPVEALAAPALDAVAYLSWASGSRVAVTHRALARRISRLSDRLALAPGEPYLATSGAAADGFVLELLWPLTAGATVVVDGAGAEAPRWAHFTPAGLAAFLARSPAEGSPHLDGLRGVIVSGARLGPELVDAFHRRLTAKLYHLYSPPEAAADVSLALADPGAPPAGKPDLFPVHLLDGHGRPVPVGVTGAVHLAEPDDPGAADPGRARLRRTADRALWLPDGALCLVGHEARRVLRDGVRVDLDEIEAALLRHPAVDACHVMAREREGLEEILAYVVPAGAFASPPIGQHLRALLPPAAVPADVVPLSSLPRTADGQIDERALAAFPVADASLIARWQARIEAASGGAPARVIAVEALEAEPVRHVSALLPGFRQARAVERTSTTSSGVLAGGLAAAPARPAITDGGPLHVPADAPRTLPAALLRTAEAYPGHGVRIVRGGGDDTFVSYAELRSRALRVLAGLRARGLGPGDLVILQIEELEDYFSALWGCLLGGVAPVTVSTTTAYDRKSAVLGKLYNTWELLRHPPIVADGALVEPLAGVAALYRSDGERFRVLPFAELAESPPATRVHEPDPDDLAFLQLTSGSTGVPKCIQETHRATIHHILGARQMHGFGPGQVHLNWLPMDHSVPILLCHLKDTYLGIQQVHARPEVVLGDPLAWLDLMERHRVTHTWAPNFGYKLVNDALARSPERRWDLSSFVYTMNGAEQVTLSVAEEFVRRLAPFGVRPSVMTPAFGMAELATGITYAKDWETGVRAHWVRKSSLTGVLEVAAGPDADAIPFVCVGAPLPGVEIRIVDADNRVLPELVIGVLQIRSPCVTAGYRHNDEANREVFVGDGWFSSGDLGFIKDGRLTITGRQKEMIVVRGANYYCYELEDAVSTLPGVEPTFVAACAVDDPGSGTDGLAVFFVPRAPGIDLPLLQAIKEKVTADFGVAPLHVVPIGAESFPKTTSGKVQRTQLKKDLVNGRFDEILQRIDLALGNDSTIPEWFYRPAWARVEIGAAAPRPGVALVILDDEGLGGSVGDRLGDAAVLVERGPAFALVGPRRYALRPGEVGDYRELLAAIAADGLVLDRVLHLRTYGRPGAEIAGAEDLERAQRDGAFDVLALAQALAGAEAAPSIDLLVVSSHTQARGPEDRVAYERAAVRGLIKAISHEWPHLATRHVDLPWGEPANVDRVLREASAVAKDWEVVHRDGARWARRLEKATPAPAARALPWKRGDLILVTGGLGGVGATLAAHLLEQHQVRLVLIGRSSLDDALDDDTEPASSADTLAARRSSAERRRALADLERAGEVIYEVADVADLPRLQEIVARAEQRFSTRLAGAVHLAGSFPTRLLAEETPESLWDTLRPKLAGAFALGQLLRGGGFLIAFDTVYAYFGGVAVGGYAAAGTALEAFAHEERRRGDAPRFCFAWSHWDETGMSRGYRLREQSAAQGYAMIRPRRGVCSLLAGLQGEDRDLVIGLDGRRPNVRRHLAAPPAPVLRLAGYVASAGQGAPLVVPAGVVDRFGAPSRCEVIELAELPLTAAGELDRARLPGLGGGAGSTSAERVLPRNDLERTIAAAWREVLGLESVDVNTSFFALGGQSILLIQLLSKLKHRTGRDLTVVDLFRHPTVSALAAHLGDAPARPTYARAAERARRQQAALRQRVAPRVRPGERTSK